MTQRRVAHGSIHALLALLLLLVLAPAADAGRRSGPQYNDPPSYDGPRRAPATRPPPDIKAPEVTLSPSGTYPDVVVDEAGTAHITWNEGRGDDSDAARYCRLKRGATACDAQATLTWEKSYGTGDGPQFNTDYIGPKIVRVGDQLVILSKRYPTVSDKPDGGSGNTVVAWTSANGGSTWVGPAIVGKRNLGDQVVVGPPDDPTILNFGVDPLCEAPGPSGACIQAYKSGQYSPDSGNLTTDREENYNATMALDRGAPVVAVTDLFNNILVRRWSGNGSPLDPNQWSRNKFAGLESELAGGPAGAFLLSRQSFGGPFDVKSLSAGADGTMNPGPPVKVSEDSGAAFGELAQDPSGRLHATWSNSGFDAPGLKLRSTTAAAGPSPSFAPSQTLSDGAANGQLALDATADGGGFVAFNHTGGVVDPGEIRAVGFGRQASTGASGLGDLPGGSGGTDETCRRAKFGAFTIDAAQGCLLNGTGANRNVIVSAGEVNIQGLRIIPDADCKLVIDYRKFRIDTVGGDAQVIVSAPGVGDVVLWHGQIHRDLASVRPGSNLFEFPAAEFDAEIFGFDIPSNIPIRLERDGVHIPIEIELPKAFGGFTGRAELVADSQRGLHLDSLKIHIGPIPLGVLVVESVDLNYTGAGDIWEGDGAVSVIGGGRLDAHARFEMGDFKGASMQFTPETPITIGPFVYLLRIGGAFTVDPVQIAADALVGAGAAIKGQAPVTVDGRFTMTFPADRPASFDMGGRLNVLLFQIATGNLRFFTDGYADFKGQTGIDFGPLEVNAMMDGFVDANTGGFGASLNGSVDVCFSVDPFPEACAGVGADAALSNAGFAACATIEFPNPVGDASGGIEYPWEDFDVVDALNPALLTAEVIDHVSVPCSTSRYRVPPPRAKKAQAGGGSVFTVPGGLPSYTIALEGEGGSPRVAVTGPGGVAFSSDAPSAAGYVARPRGMHAAYVVLNKPAAGDYAVTPLGGSPGVKRTLVSEGFEAAALEDASLGGRGRSRSIRYRISNLGNGQRVTFIESGAFGTRIIGSVDKSRGTLRFKPAVARGGRREVTALVEHDGLVTERQRVGFYVAPGPPRPGAVRGLRARRRGTSVTVSWKRVAGASRYVVKLRGRRGTGTARFVAGRARSVRIPAVRKDDRITVEVRAVSKQLRLGSARKVRLKPLRR